MNNQKQGRNQQINGYNIFIFGADIAEEEYKELEEHLQTEASEE